MKLRIAAATLAAILPIACSDGDRTYPIEEVRTNRPPEIPRGAGLSDFDRLGFGPRSQGGRGANPHGAGPAAANPHGGRPSFAWNLPEGWKVLPPRQFRDAHFTLERDPSVECYLTVIAGGGGGLAANVNRWRQQMQLPPLEADAIANLPTVRFFKRNAPYVEMNGTFVGGGGEAKKDYAFFAIFLEMPGTALTFKMTGPAAVLGQEKERFLQLAESLRLESGQSAHATPPKPAPGGDDGIASGMASGASGFAWSTPEGWTRGRESSMRVVTFHPDGDKNTQCYVSMMGGSGGGIDMNVNRWLAEVGREPLNPKEVADLPTVDMLGTKGVLIEATGDHKGMDGKVVEGGGLMGIICLLDGRALFVKMVGPLEVVRRNKDSFIAFSRSLRIEE